MKAIYINLSDADEALYWALNEYRVSKKMSWKVFMLSGEINNMPDEGEARRLLMEYLND